jgi:hypothetical protein
MIHNRDQAMRATWTKMTDSEKPQIKINYWLVPVSAILIFLVSTYCFMFLISIFKGWLFPFRGELNPHFWNEEDSIYYCATCTSLAAITTMMALSWGPKALSILNRKRVGERVCGDARDEKET